MGEEVVLEVDLLPSAALHSSASGQLPSKPEVPVGSLLLYCTVRDATDVVAPITIVAPSGPAVESKDPESAIVEEEFIQAGFVKGMLLISSAQGFKLPNKEMIGKGDPYIAFQLGAWGARSKTLLNAGGNTVWNDMDISTAVTADDLRTHSLTVQVYDENSMRGDSLIGSGSLLLKRPANKIGTEVEVSVPLSDKSGKSAGRIVLKVQVRYCYATQLYRALLYVMLISQHRCYDDISSLCIQRLTSSSVLSCPALSHPVIPSLKPTPIADSRNHVYCTDSATHWLQGGGAECL